MQAPKNLWSCKKMGVTGGSSWAKEGHINLLPFLPWPLGLCPYQFFDHGFEEGQDTCKFKDGFEKGSDSQNSGIQWRILHKEMLDIGSADSKKIDLFFKISKNNAT